MIKNIFITKILLISCFYFNYAQENISVSGGESTSNDGVVSFSIGQVFYNNFENNDGSISEGIQQVYEISVISQIKDKQTNNIEIYAYPNPANDYIIIDIKDYKDEDYSFEICDINGKILFKNVINSTKTKAFIDETISSIYFIKILQNKTEIKTFKILKIEN